MTSRATAQQGNSGSNLVLVTVGAAALIIGGYYVFLRRKQRGRARRGSPFDDSWAEDDICKQIEKRLRQRYNKATVIEVHDLGGTCEAPKIGVRIVSEDFAGLGRVEMQRQCNAVIEPFLSSGQIHAVSYELSVGKAKKPQVNSGVVRTSDEPETRLPQAKPVVSQAGQGPFMENFRRSLSRSSSTLGSPKPAMKFT
ncbi:unnamed protein product [Amoebophrya sp. A120]|nr:unnamed protein product [Amoebophrya sp. A120]|eukprot:GSA120T00015245001.1